MSRFVLALDQGTTSSRAMLFDHAGRAAACSQQEFPQILPHAGHVEHDPEVLWSTQLAVARDVLRQAAVSGDDVAAIGVANQRETTVLWERSTGRPVANAIVWQSRVSAGICEALREQGYEDLVRRKTGLVIDAYFSGSKIKHLLDTIPGLRLRAERGEVLFGTVDTWLIWKLTGGRAHVTDCSNASRTMLFDIHKFAWDDELLRMLDIPRAILPEVRSSSEVYGHTDAALLGRELPIAGAAGDQQAATFGQACFEPGSAKNTYGTGCFMLLNTGDRPVASNNRLLSTVGWRIGEKTTYCLEASIFVAGAVVSWLRDGLGLVASSAEAEQLAGSVPNSGGVVFVPALVGLGAPYWDPDARGTILGITRGTTKAHICRAAIDSMALQTCDVLEAMQSDSGTQLAQLKVDGGAAVNNRLMQLQADLLGTTVRRPTVSETTALGAAYLAGLAVGFWRDLGDVARNWALDREFHPTIAREAAAKTLVEWRKAVGRSQHWASDAH